MSPNWISETLIAGSRDQVFISVDTRGDTFQRSKYGINYPYIFPPKEIQDKIPTIDGVDQFVSLDGGPYPSSSTGPIYQFSNNWTHIRGNHTIKFGGYFERSGQNDFDQINVAGTPGGTNNQNGRFVFSQRHDGWHGSGHRQRGDRPVRHLRRDRPAVLHALSWPHVRVVRAGFVEGHAEAALGVRTAPHHHPALLQPVEVTWSSLMRVSTIPAIAVTQNPANGFITAAILRSALQRPGDSWRRLAGCSFGAGTRRHRQHGPVRLPVPWRGEESSLKIHKNNFQPRLGIAYAINEKNVIRAGVGRFYTRLGVSDSVFLGGNPPLQPTVSITRGSVDNPGGHGLERFPVGQSPLRTRSSRTLRPGPGTRPLSAEIGFNTLVEVGYVGRRGLARPARAQHQSASGRYLPGQSAWLHGRLSVYRTGSTTRFNADALRPFKGFGIIRLTNNDANSMYHGLQVSANRRFSDGFLFGAAYTLSKSSDDGSAQRDVVPNAFDVSNLWGPSTYDRRHVLVLNAVYQLPFFKDKSSFAGKLLGGWTVSAISQFQTGQPVTIASGDDFAGVGPGSGSQLWIVNGDPTLSDGEKKFSLGAGDSNYWFRVNQPSQTCALGSSVVYSPTNCVFTRPAPEQSRTSGRGAFCTTPGSRTTT